MLPKWTSSLFDDDDDDNNNDDDDGEEDLFLEHFKIYSKIEGKV